MSFDWASAAALFAFLLFIVLMVFIIAFIIRAWNLMGKLEKYLDSREASQTIRLMSFLDANLK